MSLPTSLIETARRGRVAAFLNSPNELGVPSGPRQFASLWRPLQDARALVPPEKSESTSSSRWSPETRRLTLAAAILLIEYLLLSFAFDAQTVGARGGVWEILGQAGNIGPLLVVGATAFLLLPSRKAETGGAPAASEERLAAAPNKPLTSLLLLHVLILGLFFVVTHLAFGQKEPPPGPALAWMLAFATLGVATASTLAVGLLGNWSWLWSTLRRALLAGGILGVAGWLAGSLSTQLWAPLSRATFLTVASLLKAVGFELFADYEQVILELEGFSITVAPVCSGFEGIGLFTALMGAYLYRVRETLRFPQALLLLPLGMAAVWFGNAVRIAALMIVGARLDPEIAVGSFHSKAGWVFFCAITLGVAALSRASSFFTKKLDKPRSKTLDANVGASDPAPWLVPLLTWIGVGLATSAFSDGHDPLYALRVVITLAVLFPYRKHYLGLVSRPSLASVLVGALVGVIWLVVPEFFGAQAGHKLPDDWSPAFRASWILTRALGMVLLVPLVEELAFRGFLARWLTQRDFENLPYPGLTPLGIVGSSLAFGAVHAQWSLAIGTGIVYALLLKRSSRLFDAVYAHAASNLVITIWVLFTSSYGHW